MYHLILRLATRYSPIILFPVSALIGFIGYKLENIISDRYTPPLKSVPEQRDERQLNKENEVESIKEHKFVPESVFEKNLPPSLRGPDPRVKKYSKEP